MGSIWEASCGVGEAFEAVREVLGALGDLVAMLGGLGDILVDLGAILGCLWDVLGCLWDVLWRSLASLGASWGVLVTSCRGNREKDGVDGEILKDLSNGMQYFG